MMMNAPTARLKSRLRMARIFPIMVMFDPPSGAAAPPQSKPRAESLRATRPEFDRAPHVPPRYAGREYADERDSCQEQFMAAWPRTWPAAFSTDLPIRYAFLQGSVVPPYCCIAVAASILAHRGIVSRPPAAGPGRSAARDPCRCPAAPSAAFPLAAAVRFPQ